MGRVLTPPGTARADSFINRIHSRLSALERRGQPPIAAAASLPASPGDGQPIDLHPRGIALSPAWSMVYREDLDAGGGAWSFRGGSPWVDDQSTGGTYNTASVVTTTAMVDGPSITLPAGMGGDYQVTAYGSLQATAVGRTDCIVWLAINGTAGQAVGTFTSETGAFDLQSAGALPRFVALAANDVLTLRVGTNAMNVDVGGRVPWRLLLEPIQIRP